MGWNLGGILARATIGRLACWGVACFVGLQLGVSWAETVDPAAPTGNQAAPGVREQQWRAGQSKYDGKRREWLDRVAAGDSAGAFRADWSSLEQYRAPAWYVDARFRDLHSLGALLGGRVR